MYQFTIYSCKSHDYEMLYISIHPHIYKHVLLKQPRATSRQ